VGLTSQEIQNNVDKARDLMQRSQDQHFAVGAFNIDNQDTLISVARAAQKLKAPVLVEVSYDEVEAMGADNIRDMVNNYKAQYSIEMYINLDHSPTVEASKKAIDIGFEFIHIDISQANHDASDDDIITGTKEVVGYAKSTGALVESEPHHFGGSSNLHTEEIDYEEIKKTFTTPEGAKAFVETTGIDTFAVAIGNLHGRYPVPKQLDLELLSRIRSMINCNISLHGGSGTPLHYFTEAAKLGVSKININSDLRYIYRTSLEKVLADNPDQYAVVKIMEPVRQAVQSVVEEKIQAFGSGGKAILGN
jgi:fructose-bisphosphate aldolase class II